MAAEGLSVRREKNGAGFALLVPRLEVLYGQALAVVGASGCGKSPCWTCWPFTPNSEESRGSVLYL